ncbi:MAG: hypothetical protein QNJ72_27570 [Pleurocapsa sp. MO_226.B13]|nr:hypothetical protein [Pleurocapsa sp. MO_226.B13]
MESAENREQTPKANQQQESSESQSLSKIETIRLLNESIDRLEATIRDLSENSTQSLPSSSSINTLLDATQKLADSVAVSPPASPASVIEATPSEATPAEEANPPGSPEPQPPEPPVNSDQKAITTITKSEKKENRVSIAIVVIAIAIAIVAVVWLWLPQPENKTPLISKPEVTEVAEPTTSDITSPEVVEEPEVTEVAEPTTSDITSPEVTEEPEEPEITEPTTSDITSPEVTEEPEVTKVTEEPEVTEVTEEPEVTKVTEEPEVTEVTEEPEVTEVAEPTTSDITSPEEPKPTTSDITSPEVAEEPEVTEVTEPTTSDITSPEEPETTEVAEPIVGENTPPTKESINSEPETSAEIPIPQELKSSGKTKNLKIEKINPELTLTPEQNLIAALQTKMTELTSSYDPDLYNSIRVDLANSSLLIEVTDNWYELEESRQDKLVNEILQRSRKLNFDKLQLLDSTGTVVARNPAVGDRAIIVQSQKVQESGPAISEDGE